MGSESRTGFEFVGFEFQALNSSLGREELQHSLHMLSPLFVFRWGGGLGFSTFWICRIAFVSGWGVWGGRGVWYPTLFLISQGFRHRILTVHLEHFPAWLRGQHGSLQPGSEDCVHLCSLAPCLCAFGQILYPLPGGADGRQQTLGHCGLSPLPKAGAPGHSLRKGPRPHLGVAKRKSKDKMWWLKI